MMAMMMMRLRLMLLQLPAQEAVALAALHECHDRAVVSLVQKGCLVSIWILPEGMLWL